MPDPLSMPSRWSFSSTRVLRNILLVGQLLSPEGWAFWPREMPGKVMKLRSRKKHTETDDDGGMPGKVIKLPAVLHPWFPIPNLSS